MRTAKWKDVEESSAWAASPAAFLIERHLADAMATAHWHDHVEINLLLEGEMTYLFNGRQERVGAGRIVLFWAAIPHQTINVTPEAPLICIYLPLVEFLALPLGEAARRLIMGGVFITDPYPEQPRGATGPQWFEEWEGGVAGRRQLVEDEVKLLVRRLILDYMEEGTKAGVASATPVSAAVRHAEALTSLINTRFAEPLSLGDIAKLAHLHPTTANKAFRTVLGMSVMEYLTRYRIARAMQRLAETGDAILEIAHDCGFGSSSRFYDVFKRRTGKTPRQFRVSVAKGLSVDEPAGV